MLFNMMSAVANGMRFLRHRLYAEYLQRKIEEASLYDKMTVMLSKKGLLIHLEKQEKPMSEMVLCLYLSLSWQLFLTGKTKVL